MKNLLILSLMMLISFSGFSQEEEEAETDPNNMVKNGNFAKFEGKLKKHGQFDLVQDWKAGNAVIPDLYAKDIKGDEVAVPKNLYGEQEPAEGDGYAGFTAYGYRGRVPRSYLTTKLTKSMLKDKLYCVKFRLSLAELSKYAVNNVGVHFSRDEPDVKTTTSLLFENSVVTDNNPIVEEMDGWYLFCKIFQPPRGQEQYMTIGNFASDDDTRTEKMRRPTGYTSMQENMAYYYVDDVSVKLIDFPGECDCSEGRVPESKIIYSKSLANMEGKTLSEKAEASTIYFYQFKPEVTSSFHKDLDNLVNILKENQLVRLKIISHIDDEEADMVANNPRMGDLAQERANSVMQYFMQNGINRGRLVIDVKGNSDPVSEMNTPLSLAKNRRVEFQITK